MLLLIGMFCPLSCLWLKTRNSSAFYVWKSTRKQNVTCLLLCEWIWILWILCEYWMDIRSWQLLSYFTSVYKMPELSAYTNENSYKRHYLLFLKFTFSEECGINPEETRQWLKTDKLYPAESFFAFFRYGVPKKFRFKFQTDLFVSAIGHNFKNMHIYYRIVKKHTVIQYTEWERKSNFIEDKGSL